MKSRPTRHETPRTVALDQQIIAQLPLIVENAALGLAGSNLTVLNGSEGITEVVSSLVGQGLAILDSVKRGVGSSVEIEGSTAARTSRRQDP